MTVKTALLFSCNLLGGTNRPLKFNLLIEKEKFPSDLTIARMAS